MRSKIAIVITLLPWYQLFAQQVIDFNGHKGVLFVDTVKLDFSVDSAASRFTPSKNEAILAEEILFKKKEEFVKKWGKSFNKEIKKSNRQFVGYYDLKGEKHIIVLLLNVNKNRSDDYFKTWLTKPVVGFGEFYEKNLKILIVNLSHRYARIY
jgi:hypothetical protein